MFRSLRQLVGKQKTVESPVLNRLGAQVARTLFARAVLRVRPRAVRPEVAEAVATLDRDGIVVVQDYLPHDTFEAVSREARAALASCELTVLRHGCNTVELADVLAPAAPTPTVRAWLEKDDFLFGILEAVERHPIRRLGGHRVVERLKQGDGREIDPETEVHSDTYFSTHKAWLYLSDVELRSGPLTFVQGSHRLSLRQLGFVYRESCGGNAGSRRIGSDELGERSPMVLTCRANTLVVANTFGFHARLRGVPGQERYAVQVSVRSHPFRPRQDVA